MAPVTICIRPIQVQGRQNPHMERGGEIIASYLTKKQSFI